MKVSDKGLQGGIQRNVKVRFLIRVTKEGFQGRFPLRVLE